MHDSVDNQPTPRGQKLRGWWSIVGVLVGLELRQRLRTTRWKITLAIAFVVLSLFVFGSMYLTMIAGSASYRDWSQNLYSIVIAVELFFGIVLAPTLSATAINGDRKDATLAVVQATPISHWQLAIGKLVGNWVSCLVLVLAGSPYLIWGIIAAPYGIGLGLLGVVVLCLLFACYCGLGLGFSALTARPAGSAVLTQATVFFLVLGLPALFGLLYPTVAQDHRVIRADYTYDYFADEPMPMQEPDCQDVEETERFIHTERIWWLLAPNPFLILPDVVAQRDTEGVDTWDTAMAPIAASLSAARVGPYVDAPTCSDGRNFYSSDGTSHRSEFYEAKDAHETARIGDSWYVGLLVNLIFGGIGLVIAARRLRVPAGKLPKGVRIA
ncbi:MAG: ABC transporter permease subunit [Rhodococcus sp.]|nr:ABC transporter permease subunit [Rhodococcus sp. (in: high G+C Gram-positive bacteria)]